MPPTRQSDTALLDAISELKTEMSTKLDGFNDKLNSFDNKLSGLDAKLTSIVEAQGKIEEKVSNLELQMNQQEQHDRSGNVKIFGLPLKSPNNAFNCGTEVFKALLPILKLAVDANSDFLSMPTKPCEVIAIAHTSNSKNASQPTIHVRFTTKSWKSAVMAYKKEYFQSKPASVFSIADDLTALNLRLIKSLKARDNVSAVWFSNSRVKFKKANSERIHIAKPTEYLSI